MTFSNLSVFRSAYSSLSAGSSDGGEKTKKGGAFSPNTFESVAIMRSELDNQWENSYIIKYQALMQNRLNRLKQDLTAAYKSLLETSAVQQVRENGQTTSTVAVTDIYGNLLPGSTDAFKDLNYYNDQAALDLADVTGDYGGGGPNTAADGVPSYWVNDGSLTQYNAGAVATSRPGRYEMRKLYVTGPAMQITNDMKVTFRSEEVPTKRVDSGFLDNLVNNKPFLSGSKIGEYSTEVRTGAFWASINYLYNFAPREMKYSYATAYSTTTEEAGTRQLASGKQALLFDAQAVDGRDFGVDNLAGNARTSLGEDSSARALGNGKGGSPPAPTPGSRVKWSSSNPNDGYLTELTPQVRHTKESDTSTELAGNDRFITRRTVSNDGLFPYLRTNFDSASNVIKDSTQLQYGYLVADGQPGYKATEFGTEETGSGNAEDRIKWLYEHDGKNSADLNRDGNVDGTDEHKILAGYVNHYVVATQDVELNSSVDSFGKVYALKYNTNDPTKPPMRLVRSTGIDASADKVWSNSVDPANKRIDNTSEEKLLVAGSGKIAKTFDGKFVAKEHQIKSFNGQNIATNASNVSISTQNTIDPVVIAEYEGFRRAEAMSKGQAHDYFTDFNLGDRSLESATSLANKLATEINASTMVDTDWHYSTYKDSLAGLGLDKVMFRNIGAINYSQGGTSGLLKVNYAAPFINDGGTPTNYNDDTLKNVNVAFRKTFNLSHDEFESADYKNSLSVNTGTGQQSMYDEPTASFYKKSARVVVSATGMVGNMDIIVNGNIIPNVPSGTTVDLAPFLVEGDNVIAAQMTVGGGAVTDGFKLIPEAAGAAANQNNKQTVDWINAKISTVRTLSADPQSKELNNSLITTSQSSWQSKVMVKRATTQVEYDSIGSRNTVTKVKDQNAFAKLLTEALNKKEYQDVFNLGLLNSNAGKNMAIKAQVSSPNGGTMAATMEIRFDPINNKFILVQNKLDAFNGI